MELGMFNFFAFLCLCFIWILIYLCLGGNNGCIIMEDADLDMALNAVLFAAVGTADKDVRH